MRLRPAEIEQLAAAITAALVAHEFVRAKASPAILTRRITELITRNFDEERALEAEAERLAATHARQMVGMDHRKIVQGIKERLARERGFSL